MSNLDLTALVTGQAGGEITVNDAFNRLDAAVLLTVKDRDLTAPPGGEADGDRYLVATGATGAWSGHDGEIAAYYAGWVFFTVLEGWRMWVDDENVLLVYDGSAWVKVQLAMQTVETGITASTTQSQGQQPLTKEISHVATVANANDVVTLPVAAAGKVVSVLNRGANTLQIFPASGDDIDDGSTDASTTLATLKYAIFFAVDATSWYKHVGA